MFKSNYARSRCMKPVRLVSLGITCLLFFTSTDTFAQYLTHRDPQIETLHQKAGNAMQQGNYAIAFCIWQPLATEGDNRAQYNIGWMYHNGYGLSINDEIALYWWLKAASTGSADAHFALGDLYASGQGVEKNMAIALGWYISASLKDHIPARETLMTLLNSDDRLAIKTFQTLLQNNWSIFGDTMEIGVDRANTRRGPATSYQIVATLERGHPVIPIKEKDGWTYIGITGLGKTAWVFSSLIAKPAGIYPVEEASVK